jgi:hypothetical protein
VTDTPERISRRLRAARVSSQPPRLRATFLALGIIFALAYVFVLRAPPSIPAPDITSIQGTFVLVRNRATPAPGATPRPASTLSGSFAALASGDAGGTLRRGPSPQTDEPPALRSSYDASRRAEQTTRTLASGTRTTRTFDAWPPVWRVGTSSPLDYQGLAAVVRSAVEDKDRSVGIKPLKDGDRAVWRAAMELDGSTIELVVDQQTGLVLWYSDTSGSRNDTFSATPAWGATPSRDQIGGLAAATASAGSPHGVETLRGTDYTYAASLSTAGRRAGYTPLEPTLVPDGFAVKAVATAAATGAPREWLIRGPAPPPLEVGHGEQQVDLLYTRGLTWFTVQQLGPWAARASADLVKDVLASNRSAKLSFQSTPLQYGAFTGGTAYTWYERSGPTLLVSDRDSLVYVTGALTRQELITLAEGLEPQGGGTSASPSPAP